MKSQGDVATAVALRVIASVKPRCNIANDVVRNPSAKPRSILARQSIENLPAKPRDIVARRSIGNKTAKPRSGVKNVPSHIGVEDVGQRSDHHSSHERTPISYLIHKDIHNIIFGEVICTTSSTPILYDFYLHPTPPSPSADKNIPSGYFCPASARSWWGYDCITASRFR